MCVCVDELMGGWEGASMCVYIAIVKYFPCIERFLALCFTELLMFYC